jgi:DeoR family fructose operon transcriptional repressor
MWYEERHQKIKGYLKAFGRLSIDTVTTELGVSRETIRRDLLELEIAGALRRVRGGAVVITTEDTDFKVRVSQRLEEKQAIAKAALQFLSDDMTIFIDAGTTTTVMADILGSYHGLTGLVFLTNSIDVAQRLSANDGGDQHRYRVHLLSGDVKQQPLETWGAATINDINRFRADVAILAPWGVDARRGAMNYFIHGAEIARAMVTCSDKTIVLADHSKVGAPARSVFCNPAQITHLIVDQQATECEEFSALQQTLASLVVAG